MAKMRPTVHLRIKKKEHRQYLGEELYTVSYVPVVQQLFVDDNAHTYEWRDLPEVESDAPETELTNTSDGIRELLYR